VVLWTELATSVHLWPGDVAVDVHPARHNHQPRCVYDLRPLAVNFLRGDDAPILHPDVAYFAVDPIQGVMDLAVDDA
jgi:hypothetical protein